MSCPGVSIQAVGFEDLAAIRRMAVESAGFRAAPQRGISEASMRTIRARDLEGLERVLGEGNLRIYKATNSARAVVGYVIVVLPFEHPVTGELQAEVDDLYVKPEFRRRGAGSLLLARAEQFVSARAIKYSSVEVMSENLEGLAFLQHNGYREESRLLLTTEFTPSSGTSSNYSVRLARPSDWEAIRRLTVETVVLYKPEQRDIDDAMLGEFASLRTCGPSVVKNGFCLVVETRQQEFAGFLWAEHDRDRLCNAEQLTVVNIAVERKFRGKRAAFVLYNRFLQLALERDVRFISGSVATANRCSYRFFTGVWKAREERRQLARRLETAPRR